MALANRWLLVSLFSIDCNGLICRVSLVSCVEVYIDGRYIWICGF